MKCLCKCTTCAPFLCHSIEFVMPGNRTLHNKAFKRSQQFFKIIKERYLNHVHSVAADQMWWTVKYGLTNSDTTY